MEKTDKRPWDIAREKAQKEKPPLAPIIEDQPFPFVISGISTAAPKAEIPTLGFPFYTLEKNKVTEPIKREFKNGTFEIIPGPDGMPTIYDRDILLFVMGELSRAVDGRMPYSSTVRFSVMDFIRTTGRSIGGRSYILFREGLSRLHTTSIRTNIRSGGKLLTEAFHFIEAYRILDPQDVKIDESRIMVEIKLNTWSMNALLGKEMLAISSKYYSIKNPTERRLYEIGRKFCGYQPSWKIGFETLYTYTGLRSRLRDFKCVLRKIVKKNNIPEYNIEFDEDNEMIIFSKKEEKQEPLPRIFNGRRAASLK